MSVRRSSACLLAGLLAAAQPATAGWFDCKPETGTAARAAPPEAVAPPADPALAPVDGRRVPGRAPPPFAIDTVPRNVGAVGPPPPSAFPRDHIPVPDRWRLADSIGVKSRWFDPYNQNTFKGDRPICGTHDLFLTLSAISDTVIEPRSFPTPVGVQTTQLPGSNDTFGRANSLVLAQTFIVGAALTKGSTAFKPPEFEVRVALAVQINQVNISERRILYVEPSKGTRRTDAFIGVQELSLDYHLRNVSDRYDFDSLRIGIQPFSTDFRGFLFQDNQLGVRLFGDRDNNRFQYNLAVFRRLEKDTNSGLNSVLQTPRNDYVFIANVYRQDLPLPGLTSQLTLIYNRNREANDVHVDRNGFPVRPALLGTLRGRDYDVAYLGYNADGRIGRVNLTASAYYAFGEDRNSIFTGRAAKISALFGAAEASMDFNWTRVRVSGLYASGDNNPYDDSEHGFDAIQENPQFAGADTSYWIRQTIPFAGGGRAIGVNGRNGILNDLRSSKDEGQSNFDNPGTILVGVGADFEILPELRVSANINHLWFDTTATLQALRVEGSIPKTIGTDYSTAIIYRPHMNQNLVFRLSGALFAPSSGFADLFTNSRRDTRYYSVLFNAVVAY